jgi:putative transposase
MCVKNSIGPIPEEHRVRYWLKNHADKSALLAARYGEEAFKNKAMSYIRRDWSNVEVNEMWVGDHHVFDVFVKSRDDDKQKWVAVRPWLTGWLDAKSLYFTGACIRVEEPNHVAILTALQNGILCSGGEVPEALYIDNGKDFLKAGAGEVWTVPGTEYEHGVCKELGIGTVKKSLPYNARAKLIERIFKEVCERFSRRWAQYLGNRPDARPEAAGYFQKNPEELPSLHEFSVQFQKFLDEEYHRTCQNGKILSGRCPADAWKLKPEKRKLTEKELWFSMLVPYTKNTPKVGRGAAVQIEKREYKSDVLWNYFGEKIMVKQDTVNGGNPQAFELSGKYICELEEIDLVPAFAKTAEDRKKISEGMKQQRQEVKRAFGIANEMSKGMRTVAAQDVLQLGGGPPRANNSASPVKVGSRRSVKGSTHNFEHYRIAPGGDELSRGEEKKQKLEAFDNECGMQAEDAGISDSDSIAEFHKHITSSKRETDPEDWPTGWIS